MVKQTKQAKEMRFLANKLRNAFKDYLSKKGLKIITPKQLLEFLEK